MKETDMAELLIAMLDHRVSEIESIVDTLNSIDRDYLWDIDEDDLINAVDILHNAANSAKKEWRRRK